MKYLGLYMFGWLGASLIDALGDSGTPWWGRMAVCVLFGGIAGTFCWRWDDELKEAKR